MPPDPITPDGPRKEKVKKLRSVFDRSPSPANFSIGSDKVLVARFSVRSEVKTKARTGQPRTPADHLCPMPPSSGDKLDFDPRVVEEWRGRVADKPLLMLISEDRDLLTEASYQISAAGQFEKHRKSVVDWMHRPSLLTVLSELSDEPLFIAANAWVPEADAWLAQLPLDNWDFNRVMDQLNQANAKLLILATPARLQSANLHTALTDFQWVDRDIDPFGPRLRGAIPAHRQAELIPLFKAQREEGKWGETREHQVQNLKLACERDPVEEIEQYRSRPQPNWNELLSGDDVLIHIVLFVASYFTVGESCDPDPLTSQQFDAAVQLILPLAAENALLPGAKGEETPHQRVQMLRQLWNTRRGSIVPTCGLKPGVRGIDFEDSDWRLIVTNLFVSDYVWTFLQLCEYVRRPEFIFPPVPAPVATGALKPIAAYVGKSSGVLPDLVLQLIASSGAGGATVSAEQAASIFASLTDARKETLLIWLARLLRECTLSGYGDQAEAALKKLLDIGCHTAAMSLLVRIWTAPGFKDDRAMRLAKRLFSESPAEAQWDFYLRFWLAICRGEISLLAVFRQRWLPEKAEATDAPARIAVGLILSAIALSVSGLNDPASDPVLRDFLKEDTGTARDFLKWLWHPAVDQFLDTADDAGAQTVELINNWIVPESIRNDERGESCWPYRKPLTDSFIDGYVLAALRNNLPVSLPAIFRASALTTWMTASQAGLGTVFAELLPEILDRPKLKEFRTQLPAIDSGVGSALELLASSAFPRTKERDIVRAHLRDLRERLRRIRSAGAQVKTARAAE